MKLKYTTEEVIEKFKTIHGDKYDYSKFEYLGNRNKSIIICPTHGEFLQHSNSHLSGQGCRNCFIERNTLRFISAGWKANINKRKENFIEDCKIKSPTLLYDKTVYNGKKNKVIVTCPVHGDYETRTKLLLNGVICRECHRENFDERWTKKGWIDFCKRKGKDLCTFYLLQFEKKEEVFIKFGITSNLLKVRIGNFPTEYAIKIIKEIKDTPEVVWNIEKYIKNNYKDFKYKPIDKFSGSAHECLNLNCLNNLINDKTMCRN